MHHVLQATFLGCAGCAQDDTWNITLNVVKSPAASSPGESLTSVSLGHEIAAANAKADAPWSEHRLFSGHNAYPSMSRGRRSPSLGRGKRTVRTLLPYSSKRTVPMHQRMVTVRLRASHTASYPKAWATQAMGRQVRLLDISGATSIRVGWPLT